MKWREPSTQTAHILTDQWPVAKAAEWREDAVTFPGYLEAARSVGLSPALDSPARVVPERLLACYARVTPFYVCLLSLSSWSSTSAPVAFDAEV